MKVNKPFPTWLLEQLYVAYLDARKGKRTTLDEHRFEVSSFDNLINLRDCIIHRCYHPSRSKAFPIQDPVRREIFAAPFRDRVVHHFLCNVVVPWWENRFINGSYSCRKGRGTLFGIKDLEKHIRQVSHNYARPAFVLKFDIQGYFMNLNRKKLYQRVRWGLDRQFPEKNELYRTCRYLWKKVIFDNPTVGARKCGKTSEWAKLPTSKSLFFQPPGHGIVIGNYTSQVLSNIMLDLLDRFVTIELGYKHYGRYVDDFFIVVSEDEFRQALRDISHIKAFVENLDLHIHPKKCHIQEAKRGVEFLGTVIYPGRIVPGKRLVKNFHQTARECATGERDIDSIISYLGHIKHINGKKLAAQVFDKHGWILRL